MYYRIQFFNGISNLLTSSEPMYFKRLENAIATAMAADKEMKVVISSWHGSVGKWVPQMERTPEHCHPDWWGRMPTPPRLRFLKAESGCTHLAPPQWEPYDGVPADTGSV